MVGEIVLVGLEAWDPAGGEGGNEGLDSYSVQGCNGRTRALRSCKSGRYEGVEVPLVDKSVMAGLGAWDPVGVLRWGVAQFL